MLFSAVLDHQLHPVERLTRLPINALLVPDSQCWLELVFFRLTTHLGPILIPMNGQFRRSLRQLGGALRQLGDHRCRLKVAPMGLCAGRHSSIESVEDSLTRGAAYRLLGRREPS